METIDTKVKGTDAIAAFRHFEDENGNCYFNIGASYDAKLDIVNGVAYPITSGEYGNVDFPTVNELVRDGILKEVNDR